MIWFNNSYRYLVFYYFFYRCTSTDISLDCYSLYILQDNVTKVSTYNSNHIENALSILNCENEKSTICCQNSNGGGENDNVNEGGNGNSNGGGHSGKRRRKREGKGGSSSSGGSQSMVPNPLPSICLSFACHEGGGDDGHGAGGGGGGNHEAGGNGKSKRSVNEDIPGEGPGMIESQSVQEKSMESTTIDGVDTEKESDTDFEKNAKFLQLLMHLDERTRQKIGHK